MKTQKPLTILLALILPLLVSCTASPASPMVQTLIDTPQPFPTFFPTISPEPTNTPPVRVFTPMTTNTPWIFSTGLSIEEHPLEKQPEIEPLVIHPLDALTQTEILLKHNDEWGKTLPPNEYYSVGHGDLWVMQGNDKLEVNPQPNENVLFTSQVTRNGNVIFSTPIDPPGVTSAFRVLTLYDTHWVLETTQAKPPLPPNTQQVDSFFKGEVFIDGHSLDALHGYDQSFGFQTIHGRPFYFYTRNGKTGVSYDGQEIPLGYDGVYHYGCCSGGALNPRMAQNIIGFFAWRGDRWYYTEIGVFGQQ
jgi:hypothetical protein